LQRTAHSSYPVLRITARCVVRLHEGDPFLEYRSRVLIATCRSYDPLDGIPHDLAVLDTCIKAVLDSWRVAPIPDVDSSAVRGGKSALRKDWPALATALDHLAACPDLVTLLSQ
jgi:hypothetical protein